MSELHQTIDSWNLPFPKCPYNKSFIQWILRLGIIVVGTLGLIFVNLWISIVYLLFSVVYTFYLMPVKHCQNCYYNIKGIPRDRKEELIFLEMLSVDMWKNSNLKNHVVSGKKWGAPFLFILWLTPIALMIISLVLDFSMIALIVLITFIVLLIVMGIHMKIRVCPNCAFMDECHTAF